MNSPFDQSRTVELLEAAAAQQKAGHVPPGYSSAMRLASTLQILRAQIDTLGPLLAIGEALRMTPPDAAEMLEKSFNLLPTAVMALLHELGAKVSPENPEYLLDAMMLVAKGMASDISDLYKKHGN